ncbi:plasmid mobilization protein [Helicobacter mehlei]|uniref:plasmid mobilization protein n=1 Tax=Helicobacter mehlei TaxID=2316080 RepID=UPI000EAD7045
MRFTPNELEQIKHKAQEKGLNVSEYLCFCTLNQQNNVAPQDLQEFRKQQEHGYKLLKII